jgi:hypothetical protein
MADTDHFDNDDFDIDDFEAGDVVPSFDSALDGE